MRMTLFRTNIGAHFILARFNVFLMFVNSQAHLVKRRSSIPRAKDAK